MASQLEQIIAEIEELADKELKWSFGIKGVGGEARARYDAMTESADIVRTHIETEDQSRHRFEAWRIMQCDEITDLRRDENGDYEDSLTRSMHLAWQASQTFTEASE